ESDVITIRSIRPFDVVNNNNNNDSINSDNNSQQNIKMSWPMSSTLPRSRKMEVHVNRTASVMEMIDLKKDMKELLNMDDFDECRARANSGGSLYGVLRKKVLQRGGVTASSFKEQPSSIASLLAPSSNTSLVDKQRSRSMTNRGVSPVTAKDKGIDRSRSQFCMHANNTGPVILREMFTTGVVPLMMGCARTLSLADLFRIMSLLDDV
ncbi:hypothetical protein ACDT12_13470, partial [Staphylococcus aureus]